MAQDTSLPFTLPANRATQRTVDFVGATLSSGGGLLMLAPAE